MKFTLPLPPPINQTYGVNRNSNNPLYKRQPVKDWEEEAGWAVKIQQGSQKGTKTFTGPVRMSIYWYIAHGRDIDAGLKVLLDLFQKQQVYLNDRQVKKITHMEVVEDKINPRCEVELYETT